MRLKRRKIGGERKLGHGPGKVWWIWVKNVCWCAKTSPKIQGGIERLTINERQVPELEVHQNCNTERSEPTTGWWLLLLLFLLLLDQDTLSCDHPLQYLYLLRVFFPSFLSCHFSHSLTLRRTYTISHTCYLLTD